MAGAFLSFILLLGGGSASNTATPQPRAQHTQPRAGASRRTPSDDLPGAEIARMSWTEIILSRWELLAACALGLAAFKLLRHWPQAPPQRPATTGRLASTREQRGLYAVAFGRGGYLLGRQLTPFGAAERMWLSSIKKNAAKRRPAGEDPALLRVPFEWRLRHVLTEGATGSGKTSALIVPQLIEDAYSGVCNDFLVDRKSPELFHLVAGSWVEWGHRAILFDPWELSLSEGFEPLFGANSDQIRALVEAHVQVSLDPSDVTKFYREQERAILTALFTCAQEWGKIDRRLGTLPAVAKLVALGYETVRLAIDKVRPDLNRELVDQWRLSPGDLGKLFRSLYSGLELYLLPEVAAAFSRSDFTVADIVPPVDAMLREQRTLLIVGAHQAKLRASEFVASIVTQIVMHGMYERGLTMKRAGRRWVDVTPVAMWFDEIGTYSLGRFEDFIAVARDSGAAITSALQNRLQFDRINGPQASLRLRTNHGHKIYMRGVNLDIAQELSREIGNEWVMDEGASNSDSHSPAGGSGTRSKQLRWVERPIRTPDQIVRMGQNRALVFGATHPFEVELVPYYQNSGLKRIAGRSHQWALRRAQHNSECDARGRARPTGEKPRLEPPVLDWTPVVGAEIMHQGTFQRRRLEPPAKTVARIDLPATRREKDIIRAKCRDLGIDAEQEAQARHQKRIGQLTRTEASHFIDSLRGLEQGMVR